MDITLVLKVLGLGMLIAVSGQILSKTGRDEHAMFVTLAGVVTVLLMLVYEIAELFEAVRTAFGL